MRLAEAAGGRASPADVEAALERARNAIEALALASAQMQEGLPGAIQDGLKEHFRPSARHLAEMRGLIYSLRPAELEDQGLVIALKRWGERVRHEHLLPVEVIIEGGSRFRLAETQERLDFAERLLAKPPQ